MAETGLDGLGDEGRVVYRWYQGDLRRGPISGDLEPILGPLCGSCGNRGI